MRLVNICVVLYLKVSFVTFGSKTPHRAKRSKLHVYALGLPSWRCSQCSSFEVFVGKYANAE